MAESLSESQRSDQCSGFYISELKEVAVLTDIMNFANASRQKAGRYLYELVKAALKNEPAPAIEQDVSWRMVYQLSLHNSITALAYYGVLLAPTAPPEELLERWRKDLFFTVSRQIQMDIARENLAARMDQENVEYLFIKGIEIQNYYPREGMRQMSDNDILYRYDHEDDRNLGSASQKKMKEIMEGLGAKAMSDDGVVDVFLIEPYALFEMHREFLGPDQPLYDFYHKIWDRTFARDEERPCRRSISDEEHYVLMLVHSYKHYTGCGCGPREVIDCYQFLQTKGSSMDFEKVAELLEICDLKDYEQMMRHLGRVLFEGEEGTEEDWEKLDWFMGCGTYGSRQNAIRNTLAKKEQSGVSSLRAKTEYVWERLFPSPAYLQTHFPFFYRHRSLIGFLLIYRTFRGLIVRRKQIMNEFNDLKKT